MRIGFFMLMGWVGMSLAGEVRLDFLMETQGQEELARVMERNGISKAATARLMGAMKDFYEEPLLVDLSRFRRDEAGGCLFYSMESLTNALPHRSWELIHEWSLNCYDALILAAGEKIDYRLETDDLRGPFFAVVPASKPLAIRPCATPQDAFVIYYPEWYRAGTKKYFADEALFGRRICVGALLASSYALPIELTEAKLAETALRVMRTRWERYGVKFEDVEVVLAHEVNFEGRFFVTAHGGLLLRNEKRLIYFEKCGGWGPYVRLDFEKREELETWFADKYRGAETNGYSHHLISFDDREMRVVRK